MHPQITFITGNASKAEQVGRHLGVPLSHKKLDLVEIQSLDLVEIIGYKAREAYKHINAPVLVEDTSLVFTAFNRLPGPLIKWFLQELGNEGLSKMIPVDGDRSAVARVMFGYYDGVTLEIFDGETRGRVAAIPQGEKGFGWDPIFIPEGWDMTWGEMTLEQQDETSMRKIALKKLESFLKNK